MLKKYGMIKGRTEKDTLVTEVFRYNGTVQAGFYRFPACSFILTPMNAIKCLILQALRAFSVREETIVTYRKMV